MINRFQEICGTMRLTLGWKMREETQLKFYKAIAVFTILYDFEI